MKKLLLALMLLCPAMMVNASTPKNPSVQNIQKTCPKCKGKGKVTCPKCKGRRYYGDNYIDCERCGGCGMPQTSSSFQRYIDNGGKGASGKIKCPTCKGSGKVR